MNMKLKISTFFLPEKFIFPTKTFEKSNRFYKNFLIFSNFFNSFNFKSRESPIDVYYLVEKFIKKLKS